MILLLGRRLCMPANLQLLRLHISPQRAQHPVALLLGIIALCSELLQGVRLVAICCQMVTVRLLLLPFSAGAAAPAWMAPILAAAPCRTSSAPALHCRSTQRHKCNAVRLCRSVAVLRTRLVLLLLLKLPLDRRQSLLAECLYCPARLFKVSLLHVMQLMPC